MSAIMGSNPVSHGVPATQIKVKAEKALMDKSSQPSELETTRIQLQGLEGDARFFIRIIDKDMEKKSGDDKSLSAHRCVPLKINQEGKEKEVFVSVGSLSKRLLLTEKQITRASKEGRLEELVNKRAEYLIKNKTILEKYQLDSKDRSVKTKSGEETGMKIRNLFKITKSFHFAMENEKADAQKFFEVEHKKGEKVVPYIGIKIKGATHILTWENKEKLGEGHLGIAYKVLNVSSGAFQVLKLAHRGSELAIEFEPTALQAVDDARDKSKPRHPGIQAPPYAVINLTFGKEDDEIYVVGYLGRLYSGGDLLDKVFAGNLTVAEQVSLPAQVSLLKKLMSSLNELSVERNFSHSDIKPENIFLDLNGYPVIGDLTDAVCLTSEESKVPQKDAVIGDVVDDFSIGSMSRGYFSEDAGKMKVSVRSYAENELKSKEENLEKAKEDQENGAKASKSGDKQAAAKYFASAEHAKKAAEECQKKVNFLKRVFDNISRFQDLYGMTKTMREVLVDRSSQIKEEAKKAGNPQLLTDKAKYIDEFDNLPANKLLKEMETALITMEASIHNLVSGMEEEIDYNTKISSVREVISNFAKQWEALPLPK